MTIRHRLTIAFPAVVAVGVGLFGLASFLVASHHLHRALHSSTMTRLQTVNQARKMDIERDLRLFEHQLLTMATHPIVVDAARSRRAMSNPPDEGDSGAHTRVAPLFEHLATTFGYDNIFVIAPNGRLIYAVRRHEQLDDATSLASSPYADTGLGQAFRGAERADAGELVVTDFAPSPPPDDDPAAFIATPIYDGPDRLGVLAFRLPTARLQATVAAGRQWASVGLGKTGESILVGEDFRLRSPRRGLSEAPDRFLENLQAAGVDRAIVKKIKDKKTAVGLEEVRTTPVRRALAGRTGRMTYAHRGQTKLASFAPISWRGLDWALVSEMEEQEALRPLFAFRRTIGFWFAAFSIVVLAIAGGLGWFIARTLAAPIRKLSAAVRELSSRNDFSIRVDVEDDDEVATVATALNQLLGAIHRALTELSDVTEAIGNGDLTSEMKGEYRGDLATIKTRLNHTQESLSSVVGTAQRVASNVAQMADELTSSSADMANGAHAQSAAAHQSLAAMEQTSSMASVNADHAQEATRLATSAATAADGGREQMRGLSTAMTKIEESSKRIVKVTKVIEDIAFQTNLLAINAAVEAAHAGRHGRGFSVVAQEVQNLAARSATAAQETAALVRDARDAVTRGVRGATATAAAFDHIVQNVRSVESLMTEISQASVEQASGVNQVREAMSEVNQNANQSLMNSSKLQRSAGQLTAETSRLQEEVGRFRLHPAAPSLDIGPRTPEAAPTLGPYCGDEGDPSPVGAINVVSTLGPQISIHHDERGYDGF